MNFDFTEDQLALRDLVRKFVEREMPKDAVAAWDAAGAFPEGLLDKMAEIGLMGASVPEQFGGTGGGVVEETIVLEELASEQRWSESFARSQDALANLAEQALAEYTAGRTKPL